MEPLAALKKDVEDFARERRWGRYHTPKNLAMAMVKEAAEVVELFQWLTPEQAQSLTPRERRQLSDELADTYVYLLKLAACFEIDLVAAARIKMRKNRLKYPLKHRRSWSDARRFSAKRARG